MDSKRFKRIKKLKLPVKPYSSYEGETAIVTGFGWEEMKCIFKIPKENPQILSKYTGAGSRRMKFGKVTVLSNESCKNISYISNYNFIHNDSICAVMMHQKDAKIEGVSRVLIIYKK